MRDPERIDKILAMLGEVWHKNPDLRLGQLIYNVFSDPYYLEDDIFIQKIIDYYKQFEI